MEWLENVPLKKYATMRLGGPARFFTVVNTREEVAQAAELALERRLPILVIGGGSNIIVRDEGFGGLVIRNRIRGISVVEETAESVVLRIGAGEEWDEVVEYTVKKHWSGIEALSAIPGTAGATPVQNVGAYGQEIADTLLELEAYDLQTKQFVTLQKDDCGFGYRTSIFKPLDNRRYIITSITLRLTKNNSAPPFYPRLQKYLEDRHITEYTPHAIREAVIAIRKQRLPDPKDFPNAGSFFKNPVIGPWQLSDLRARYSDLPCYPMPDGRCKISAGWLLEMAGIREYADYGMRTFENNVQVFINENAQTYHDLAAFRDGIVSIVQAKFQITLEQEPELI